MKSYITSIGKAVPTYKVPQMKVAGFMAEAHAMNDVRKRALKRLYQSTGIQTRHSVLPDYATDKNENHFFSKTDYVETFPNVRERMEVFRQQALPLALASVKDCLKQRMAAQDITHLIVVSCTGMYAPGLDIELVDELGLSGNVKRTAIQFMGCYAAINAIRAGHSFCVADPDSKVLIVCLEMCSIHFRKEESKDQVLANALFGDGAAAVLMESTAVSGPVLGISSFYCDLIKDRGKNMAWTIGDDAFEMKLSSYIPVLLDQNIGKLLIGLLQHCEITSKEIDFYAIHPGGKKILQVCEEHLGITEQENIHSHKVLKEYGNMSSPTILFVLRELLDNLNNHDHGKKVLALAFGPGITVESMMLQVNYV